MFVIPCRFVLTRYQYLFTPLTGEINFELWHIYVLLANMYLYIWTYVWYSLFWSMQLDQMLELYWFIVCHQNRKARPETPLWVGRQREERTMRFLGWAILNLITRNLLFLFCVCHWLSARSRSFDMNGKEWKFFLYSEVPNRRADRNE